MIPAFKMRVMCFCTFLIIVSKTIAHHQPFLRLHLLPNILLDISTKFEAKYGNNKNYWNINFFNLFIAHKIRWLGETYELRELKQLYIQQHKWKLLSIHTLHSQLLPLYNNGQRILKQPFILNLTVLTFMVTCLPHG